MGISIKKSILCVLSLLSAMVFFNGCLHEAFTGDEDITAKKGLEEQNMITVEKIPLWTDVDSEISLTRYVRDDGVSRPAMLVVPGGGYGCVCLSTEGYPIAERFLSLGFQVFILNYRVYPELSPKPFQDILRAIKMIRANANDWHVNKDNIAAVGFSAGGHLCAAASNFYDEIDANCGDAADFESGRPDAVLLAYSVITFDEKDGHVGSGQNLLGSDFEARKDEFSLEKRVTEKTSPAFIWHTVMDQIVPVQNSFMYADALMKHNVPCELHIFQNGAHGSQLGYGIENISAWPEQSVRFLREICKFRFPEKHPGKTVILTFDDACRTQMDNVVPLLVKYGFGATFFICRFSDAWRAEHESTLMTVKDVAYLNSLGFEIGNHSWNHPCMSALSLEDATAEIEKMTLFMLEAGVPTPVSFAYPGGPDAENVHEILYRNNYKYARIVEERPWNPGTDDKYRIPSFSICGEDKSLFYNAVAQAEPGKPVVLVFHGVPDNVHQHVTTRPEIFAEYMKYLYDNGFDVCSLRDY